MLPIFDRPEVILTGYMPGCRFIRPLVAGCYGFGNYFSAGYWVCRQIFNNFALEIGVIHGFFE